MVESVRCPKCFAHVPPGRLCERCGAPLPQVEHLVSERVEPSVSPSDPFAVPVVPTSPKPPVSPRSSPAAVRVSQPVNAGVPRRAEPSVAIDELCIQYESWSNGFLRVIFDPGEGFDGCDGVTLILTEQDEQKVPDKKDLDWKDCKSGEEKERKRQYILMKNAWCNSPREIRVSVDRHAFGPVVYDISLSYEKNGRRCCLVGSWATVSIRDEEARDTARQLVVNIVNNITTGHACDVNNSTLVKDKLEDILKKDVNVSQFLQDLVLGPDRAYAYQDLYDETGIASLPSPQPVRAKTDRLILDLGLRRVLLFSGRTVTFGRARSVCDISWRHPDADRIEHDDPENIPYRKISGRQCSFEHRGDKVALIDGVRDERGIVKPSSYGTFLNAVQVEGEKLLASDGMGRGLITFSDSAATGTLSVCLPNDVCAECTRAERTWCGGGKRPSLMFKRLDGVPESAVMVWSCFRLEEVDPSFEGVKIFRSDGGFAWRRGRRCGWLVPGESIETECGTVYVRHLPSPAEIAKEKNDVRNMSETCHS